MKWLVVHHICDFFLKAWNGGWCVNSYEPVSFSHAVFIGYEPVSFSRAVFIGYEPVSFSRAVFIGYEPVSFSRAVFIGHQAGVQAAYSPDRATRTGDCRNFGHMTKLCRIIPAWVTLTFSHGHMATGRLELTQLFCGRVAWSKPNVHDGWLCKGYGLGEVLRTCGILIVWAIALLAFYVCWKLCVLSVQLAFCQCSFRHSSPFVWLLSAFLVTGYASHSFHVKTPCLTIRHFGARCWVYILSGLFSLMIFLLCNKMMNAMHGGLSVCNLFVVSFERCQLPISLLCCYFKTPFWTRRLCAPILGTLISRANQTWQTQHDCQYWNGNRDIVQFCGVYFQYCVDMYWCPSTVDMYWCPSTVNMYWCPSTV